MDSVIFLGVENFETAWGKNDFDRNHSCLFLPSDRTDGPYIFPGDDEEDDKIEVQKPLYARRLGSIKKRLELLGYSIEYCRELFDDLRAFHLRHNDSTDDEFVTFDRFAIAIQTVDVAQLRIPGSSENYDFGEYAARCILSDPAFPSLGMDEYQLYRMAGQFLDNIDPYVILRLLAENPANRDRLVMWRYLDLVARGYTNESEIYEGLSPTSRILVITEGSSDTNILKRSLSCKHGDVEDFFLFVDMKDNYPFPGTGNLFKFIQGLIAIQHRQRTLVVLDNDTAGNEVATKLGELKLPSNVVICVLPDLDECESFGTLGPAGSALENVNRRACSIELFLDLRFEMASEPAIRWTSFNSQLKQYQGELERKEDYTRSFLQDGWRSSEYDWSKLLILWDHLFERCRLI